MTTIKPCTLDLLFAFAVISVCCHLALLPPEDSECGKSHSTTAPFYNPVS